MRNFMCIFIVVLLNQSVSHGLHCYKSEDEGHCINKYFQGQGPGYHEKTFSCLKEVKDQDIECTGARDTCIKVIFTYVDNDTLTLTDCDNSRKRFRRCEYLKDKIDGIADKKLEHKDCEKCKTDLCNLKTKKVEATTIISKENNTKASSKEKNKSIQILPKITVLLFVVLISLMF